MTLEQVTHQVYQLAWGQDCHEDQASGGKNAQATTGLTHTTCRPDRSGELQGCRWSNMSWSAGGPHSLWALLGIETACLDIFPHAETVSVCPFSLSLSLSHRLVGLVERRPPRERKIPGSIPACARIFSGSSHTSGYPARRLAL